MAVHNKTSEGPKRRKNPPTFNHLPRNRAQKLKKSWIEKKKLKLRWKAQKRREGLDSGWPTRPRAQQVEEDAEALDSNVDEHSRMQDEESTPSSSATDDKIAEFGEPERPALPHRNAQTKVPRLDESQRPSLKSEGKRPDHSSPTSRKDDIVKTGKSEDTKSSLRELSRRAYAPSSLHTFKADPLHRRKAALTSNPSSQSNRSGRAKDGSKGSMKSSPQAIPFYRGGAASYNQGRTGSGRGRQRQTRGQPNMKLRMEAVLERIKRDYS